MSAKLTIGFLGAGKMATALARGFIQANLAGAELEALPSMNPAERAVVRLAIADSFVSAFRVVMASAAALALAAAAFGAAIR